jgi:hypothetical protein
MTATAEERLTAAGFVIGDDYLDLDPGAPDDIGGAVAFWPIPGSVAVRVGCSVRADLDPARRVRIMEWFEQRMHAYFAIGPEADGWTPRSDGGWHLCAREVILPDMDLLLDA